MSDTRLQGPIVECVAGEAVSRLRAAAIIGNLALHADHATASHAGAVRGVFVEDASLSGTARVQITGPLVDPSWNWAEGPIYVGAGGLLTQTPPSTGFVQQVARADSATRVFVDVPPPTDRRQRLTLPFAWGDATPAVVGTIPAGRLVETVELAITTAFNGSSPALRVGRTGALDELMAAAQNDPTAIGGYEVTPLRKYDAATPILLSITPGSGASAGAGLLVLTFQL